MVEAKLAAKQEARKAVALDGEERDQRAEGVDKLTVIDGFDRHK